MLFALEAEPGGTKIPLLYLFIQLYWPPVSQTQALALALALLVLFPTLCLSLWLNIFSKQDRIHDRGASPPSTVGSDASLGEELTPFLHPLPSLLAPSQGTGPAAA